METIKLSPRLQTIAGLVPHGAHIADVGTDHGYIPVYLLRNEIIQSAIASDINPGPLQKAKDNAELYGVSQQMCCRLCDGLNGISPDEADTVILAGLGGETIADILSKAPWTKTGTLLILQPMTKGDVLRRFLNQSGIRITREILVEDAGKLYSVITAEGNCPEEYSEGEYHTGKYSLISRQELFQPWLDGFIRRAQTAVSGLESGTKDDPRLKEEKALLLEWLQVKEKYTKLHSEEGE